MKCRLGKRYAGFFPVTKEDQEALAHIKPDEIIEVSFKKVGKKMTFTQQGSLHKYYELLANALNDAGLDMKAVLKPQVDIPWTKDSVKKYLWKPIQKIMLNQESTTEMDTKNPNEIYIVLDRHISEKYGVHVPWPARMDSE